MEQFPLLAQPRQELFDSDVPCRSAESPTQRSRKKNGRSIEHTAAQNSHDSRASIGLEFIFDHSLYAADLPGPDTAGPKSNGEPMAYRKYL